MVCQETFEKFKVIVSCPSKKLSSQIKRKLENCAHSNVQDTFQKKYLPFSNSRGNVDWWSRSSVDQWMDIDKHLNLSLFKEKVKGDNCFRYF